MTKLEMPTRTQFQIPLKRATELVGPGSDYERPLPPRADCGWSPQRPRWDATAASTGCRGVFPSQSMALIRGKEPFTRKCGFLVALWDGSLGSRSLAELSRTFSSYCSRPRTDGEIGPVTGSAGHRWQGSSSGSQWTDQVV